MLRAPRRFFALRILTALVGAYFATTPALGQIVKPATKPADLAVADLSLGQAIATRYRVGAQFTARGGTVRDIRTMVAVPLECPEQQVEMLEEDVTPNVEQFEYRQTDVGVRQMLIGVPQLSPREAAHAVVTFDVTTSPVLLPDDLSTLHVPKKLDKQLKRYLGPSPFIDVNHRKIKQAVKEALAADDKATEKTEESDDPYTETDGDAKPDDAANGKAADDNEAAASDDATGAKPASDNSVEAPKAAIDDKAPADPIAADPIATDPIKGAAAGEPTPTVQAGPPSDDWLRIEKLYDYARKKVTYEEGEDKSSVQALAEGRGDCQGIAALFVAMCRTEKVPARMVWADGHQYAEFYLEDAAGAGRWYPVESAGARAFGEMPTARVILQKGDNFRVPERPRDRLRYASDFTLLLSKPGSQPKITYVHEQL